jgi:hypothetical protein
VTLVRERPANMPVGAPARRSGELRRRTARRLRRTPGRLVLMLAGLVVLGAATGVVASVGVQQRAAEVERVTTRSGRLSVAAQQLYRALSDADATAAGAYLAGGIEPPALRDRFADDIAQAAGALAEVSAGGRGTQLVARIAAQLPVYTGLVETARTYNRQGLPLGAAYLREASGLMRGMLLPAAQDLYRAAAADVADARGKGAGFPWFAVPLALLTIAGLVLAQRWLTRRTNRVFNVGLVAATAAAVLLVGWLGVSAIVAGQRLDASRVRGSDQVDVLVEARIAALQARADESLTLVARGSGGSFEQSYVSVMRQLAGDDGNGGLLARARSAATDDTTRSALDAAGDRARAWLRDHQKVREADDGGDYAQAVRRSVGTGPDTTAALAAQLDSELERAIAATGRQFEVQAGRAGGTLSGVDLVMILLAALVVLGAAIGIQRRLAEYR